MKVDSLVEKYVQLRDKKASIKKEYDEKVAKYDEAMAKVEAVLLKHFEETGAESVKTGSGTAYKSSRTSATVADWDSFFEYVKGNELWHFLEHRANKKAVEEFKNEHQDIPPGLNWRSEVVVNIRRS